MRRRRKSRESFSISLFPFLAVLICTFGVLIVLLVIVVKAADHQAATASATEKKDRHSEIAQRENELDLHVIRIQGLQSLRPELLKQLQDERSRRANLQAAIDALRAEAELLNNEARLLSDSSPDDSSSDQLQAEIDQQELQLANEKKSLQERRASSARKRPTKFSVVPHDGPDGTRRRPIYIECLEDRLILQPYGISLEKSDFVEPIVANNPLDAALVAVRQYYLKNKITRSRETPYPLLIVRPQGPDSYVVARHAIKSWDEEFGYELISAEKELDFGEADPLLKQEIFEAVEAAKQRQRQYVANKLINRNFPASRSDDQLVGMQASSRLGGFVTRNGHLPGNPRRIETDEADKPKNKTAAGAASRAFGDSDSSAKQVPDIAVNSLNVQGQSIAEERGQDWALPSKSRGAVAYRRPVKIMLADDELTIESDSRSNKRVRIAFANSPSETVEDLVEAIWQRIDTWGVAGIGGYWKPELDVTVMPGGERRFRQLKQLLDNSGIDVREPPQ